MIIQLYSIQLPIYWICIGVKMARRMLCSAEEYGKQDDYITPASLPSSLFI